MPLDDQTRAALAAKLDTLWKASKPTVLDRLTLLEVSCDAWTRDPADTAALHEAHEAAHKLAGVLGTFGLQRGSQIASALETIVTQPDPVPTDSMPMLLTELRGIITAKE